MKTPRIHQLPPGTPVPSQREYFSAIMMVLEVPSGIAAKLALPSQTVAKLPTGGFAIIGIRLTLLAPPKTTKFPAYEQSPSPQSLAVVITFDWPMVGSVGHW